MNYLDTAKASLNTSRARREKQFASIATMNVDEFARSRFVIRLYSDLLDQDIFFLPDNVLISDCNSQDTRCLKVSEFQNLCLLAPSPGAVRTIGDLLHVFQGEILDVQTSD